MPFFRAPRVQQSTVLDRAPLEYAPRSSTTLNDDRLNAKDPNFWRLSLQFRPAEPSEDERTEAATNLRWLIFLTAVFVYIPPMLHVVFGPFLTLMLFGAVPTSAALYAGYRGDPDEAESTSRAGLGWIIVLYSFAVGALDADGSLLPRARGSVDGFSIPLFGYALFAMFLWVVGACYEVYVHYLAADPRCARTPKIDWWLKNPPLAAAAAFLCVVPGVLLYDVAGTVVLALVLALGALFAIRGFTSLPTRSYLYLNRRLVEFKAPGVWLPQLFSMMQLMSRRRARFVLAVACAHLSLATSTFWLQIGPVSRGAGLDTGSVFGPLLVTAPRVPFQFSADVLGVLAGHLVLILVAGLVAALASCAVLYGWAGIVMLFFARVESLIRAATSKDVSTAWATYATRLRHSVVTLTGPDGETIRESDHLYLGYEPHRQFPVMLHRPLLQEHCHVLGDSGSGKTSLGLIPLLSQILDSNQDASLRTMVADPFHIPAHAAVLILDLKGDMALFETARRRAESGQRNMQLLSKHLASSRPVPADLRGLTFRFFTPEPKRSHVFNPFNDLRAATGQSRMQIASVLLDALALNHGEGYGRSYYSKRSRDLLLHAIDQSDASNFEELYVFLNTAISADPARYRDAFELVATIRSLTSYPQLITSAQQQVAPEHLIHMPTVLDERQVVYFWLPSVVESVSVREIGKLALYCLVAAALSRRAAGLPVVPTYVFIDEFQRIAGENFKVILQQARSLGISVILSNQSMADLKTADVDLRSTVRTNTRVKLYFSVQDAAEVREISDASGLDAVTRHTASVGITRSEGIKSTVARSESFTTSVAEKARLTESDIREISDHPRRFVLHVSRGSGLTQFGGRAIPVECTYTMTKSEYDAISAASLPDDPTIPSFASAPSPAQVEKQQAIDQVQSVNEAIEQAFEAATEEEGIDTEVVAALKKRKTRKKPKAERQDSQ